MNKVGVVFEGDYGPLFQSADKVEARLQGLKKNLSFASGPGFLSTTSPATAARSVNPFIDAQRSLTRAVETESAKQTSTITAAAKRSVQSYKLSAQQILENDTSVANTRNAIRAKRESQEKAAEDRRLSQIRTNGQKEIEARVASNIAAIRLSRERAVTEAAVASPTGGGRFGNLPVGALIGGAAVGIAAVAVNQLLDAQIQSENRFRSLRAELIGFGKDATIVAAQSRKFAADMNFSLNGASAIYGQAAKFDSQAPSIARAGADVGALRNLSPQQIGAGIEKVNSGLASTELFGKNAASIFELYAASIGKTVDQLTDAERRQASINQLLKEGASNAGTQSREILTLSGSFQHLTNSVERLGDAGADRSSFGGKYFGGIGTGIRAVGDVLSGDFNFIQKMRERREQINNSYLAERGAEEQQRLANEQAIANANPYGSIAGLGLSRYLDRAKFSVSSPAGQEELIRESIAEAGKFKVKLESALSTALSSGDPMRVRASLSELNLYRGIFSEEALAEAGRRAAEVISRSVRENLQMQLDNASGLRQLRSLQTSIARDPGLSATDRNTLARRVFTQITEDVDRAKSKIRELGGTWRNAFESVRDLDGDQNPIAKALINADRRMTMLRENTKGLPGDIRRAFAQAAQAANRRELIQLRIDAAVKADDLQNQSREFRQGFRNGGFPSNQTQNQAEFQERMRAEAAYNARFINRYTGGLLNPFYANGGRQMPLTDEMASAQKQAFIADELQKNRDRETQRRIEEQIRAIPGGTTSPFEGGQWLSFANGKVGPPVAPKLDKDLLDARNAELARLAGTVDPRAATEGQRKTFRDALDYQVRQTLSAEKTAQAERVVHTGLLTKLEEEMRTLRTLAESGGLDAIVKVIDESDLANTTRQSNPGDTKGRRNR